MDAWSQEPPSRKNASGERRMAGAMGEGRDKEGTGGAVGGRERTGKYTGKGD